MKDIFLAAWLYRSWANHCWDTHEATHPWEWLTSMDGVVAVIKFTDGWKV